MNSQYQLAPTLFASVLFISCFTNADEKLSNVSYRSVTELPVTQSFETVSYGNAEQQFIEVWQTDDKPKAELIFIHGGCWLNAYDIVHSRPLTEALSEENNRVWSIEYRRTGDTNGGWPGTFNDIKTAISYIINQPDFDVANSIISGHSAGGHLALLAAVEFPQISAVIGLAAITDIELYAAGENSCQKATEQFMKGSPQELPQQYNLANPSKQEIQPNLWLVFSEQDPIVPANQALTLASAKKVKVGGAGHFDFIHPQSTAFTVINETIAAALEKD